MKIAMKTILHLCELKACQVYADEQSYILQQIGKNWAKHAKQEGVKAGKHLVFSKNYNLDVSLHPLFGIFVRGVAREGWRGIWPECWV